MLMVDYVVLGGPIFWTCFWLLILACYAYAALALQTIARKTNTPDGWFAWVPVLNLVLMLQIAGKPLWWIVLFFIPIVNIFAGIVITIVVWMAIAEKRGKPRWWGVMMIVPVMNIITPGYLAWSK